MTRNSFLQFISTSATGATSTSYSDRFTLTGMTGSFPAAAAAGVASLAASDTAGPSGTSPSSEATGTAGAGTSSAAAATTAAAAGMTIDPAAGPYGTPFPLQTGLTRYGPMPAPPGSTVGAGRASAQFPTSAVSLATAILPLPSVLTTLTQPLTGAAAAAESVVGVNTVSAARCTGTSSVILRMR